MFAASGYFCCACSMMHGRPGCQAPVPVQAASISDLMRVTHFTIQHLPHSNTAVDFFSSLTHVLSLQLCMNASVAVPGPWLSQTCSNKYHASIFQYGWRTNLDTKRLFYLVESKSVRIDCRRAGVWRCQCCAFHRLSKQHSPRARGVRCSCLHFACLSSGMVGLI